MVRWLRSHRATRLRRVIVYQQTARNSIFPAHLDGVEPLGWQPTVSSPRALPKKGAAARTVSST